MSTILDALRKSEQERKLNKLPTLTDMAAPQESSRWPMYIGLALVLVAIALIVLAFAIWSGKPLLSQVQPNAEPAVGASQAASQSAANANLQSSTDISSATVVNVVSYSDDRALRFAMVNGKMVREGEFIEPGLKVEEIRPNSVVFNARGKKITRSP